MKEIINKTFGGLSKAYYFRQLLFGSIFAALMIFIMFQAETIDYGVATIILIVFLLNTLLYPYSRFVYESIVDFILGNNTFFINSMFFLVIKIFTMLICWYFAIFIAPIGLIYLYWHHSKTQ